MLSKKSLQMLKIAQVNMCNIVSDSSLIIPVWWGSAFMCSRSMMQLPHVLQSELLTSYTVIHLFIYNIWQKLINA